MEPHSQDSSIDAFRRFDQYDFAGDEEFQVGLASILASNPKTSPELILMAKNFYYTKSVEPINLNDYTAWKRPTQRMSAREIEDALTSQDNTLDAKAGDEKSTELPIQLPATTAMTPQADADIPYPASFAEIVDMISSGKAVPGIKHIPDQTADGDPSISTSQVRAKPWETETEAKEVSFFL